MPPRRPTVLLIINRPRHRGTKTNEVERGSLVERKRERLGRAPSTSYGTATDAQRRLWTCASGEMPSRVAADEVRRASRSQTRKGISVARIPRG